MPGACADAARPAMGDDGVRADAVVPQASAFAVEDRLVYREDVPAGNLDGHRAFNNARDAPKSLRVMVGFGACSFYRTGAPAFPPAWGSNHDFFAAAVRAYVSSHMPSIRPVGAADPIVAECGTSTFRVDRNYAS